MAASWSGVATSGFAVEGGYNRPGAPANQWGRWELAGLVPVSGRACDFWSRPEPLLDGAAALGCDAFGLSVEWARVEPEDGRVDAAALDRYAEILALCAERGLSPVVTLHHRTHPEWLGEEFWLTPGAPDRFAAYVGRVVEHLGERCRRWVTLYEPNGEAAAGWLLDAAPPGRLAALSDAWAVCDNFLTGHVLAYEVLHRDQPDAEVTLAPRASSVYDGHQLLVDLLCARHLGIEPDRLDRWIADRRAAHDRALAPVAPGEGMLRAAVAATSPFGLGHRSLRRPSPRRTVATVFAGPHDLPLDALAVSWQQAVPTRLLRPPRGGGKASWVRQPWEVTPDPAGMGSWCRSQASLFPDLPRWVVDAGVARPPGGDAHGRGLAGYLEAQRSTLAAAAADGAPVTGYLLRWGGYDPSGARYGLEPAADAPFRALVAGR